MCLCQEEEENTPPPAASTSSGTQAIIVLFSFTKRTETLNPRPYLNVTRDVRAVCDRLVDDAIVVCIACFLLRAVCDHLSDDAMARASGARDVLTNAQVFDSMEAAVADLHQVSLPIPSPPSLSPPPSVSTLPSPSPLAQSLCLLTPTPSHSLPALTWEDAVADLLKAFCFFGGGLYMVSRCDGDNLLWASRHPVAPPPPPPPQPRVTTGTITTGVRDDGALARHDAEGGARRRCSKNSSGTGARERRPPAQRLSLRARDERAGKRRPRAHGLHRAGL